MRAGGVDWRMNLYGGAVHSFTNPAADGTRPGIKYEGEGRRPVVAGDAGPVHREVRRALAPQTLRSVCFIGSGGPSEADRFGFLRCSLGGTDE